MNLHELYYPLTAAPFACCEAYQEYPPCEALRPYVRCFWGSPLPCWNGKPNTALRSLVIPDTCVDVIFDVDYTNNQIEASFCGIDRQAFSACTPPGPARRCSTFAVRFYAWTAAFFAEDSLRETGDGFFDAEVYFSGLKRALLPILFEMEDIQSRIAAAERYLLSHIHPKGCNSLVLEGVAELLLHRGTLQTRGLARTLHTSTRQLERRFGEYTGVSPKQLSSLLRYQYLWRDILLQPDFQIQDAVARYEFTDQAHLLREFKRYHTMTIPEARAHARKHVAFLQDECPI